MNSHFSSADQFESVEQVAGLLWSLIDTCPTDFSHEEGPPYLVGGGGGIGQLPVNSPFNSADQFESVEQV